MPADEDSNVVEIRALIERWTAAVRAGDIDGIMAHHAPDILMFDLPGPVQLKGAVAYRASWTPLFNWIKDGGFDLSEIAVTAGADVAFATALIHCRGTDGNGNKVTTEGRLTVGLRKIAGQWTVTHEHHSEPSTDG